MRRHAAGRFIMGTVMATRDDMLDRTRPHAAVAPARAAGRRERATRRAAADPDSAMAAAEPAIAIAPAEAPTSRRHRIAALTWDALAADIAQCIACGLCKTRHKTVPGVGDAQPTGCSSARRPARRRTRAASRSSGQAGRLLDNMLGGARHDAHAQRLHRQRAQVPAAEQPHAGARRGGGVPAVSRAADRADPPEADRRARQERRVAAARHRRHDREPARPRPPLPRRAADRDLSSGLPAAQPAGQGQGVGGPAARADDRRASPPATVRPCRRPSP